MKSRFHIDSATERLALRAPSNQSDRSFAVTVIGPRVAIMTSFLGMLGSFFVLVLGAYAEAPEGGYSREQLQPLTKFRLANIFQSSRGAPPFIVVPLFAGSSTGELRTCSQHCLLCVSCLLTVLCHRMRLPNSQLLKHRASGFGNTHSHSY